MRWLAILLVTLWCAAAWGQQAPIIATAPPGTCTNQAASTAFVCGAVGITSGTNILNVQNLGAKGDTASYVDGTITAGSTAFSSATANFQPTDIGKVIIVDYAGTGSTPLQTVIAGFTDAHHITLRDAAVQTVPRWTIQALFAATQSINGAVWSATGGGQITFTTVSPHGYLVGQVITVSQIDLPGAALPLWAGTYTTLPGTTGSTIVVAAPVIPGAPFSGTGKVSSQGRGLVPGDTISDGTTTAVIDSTKVVGASVPSAAISNAVWNGSTQITFTTTAPHPYSVGQTISVSGVNPTGFNHTFTALAGTTGSTIIVGQTSNPGSYVTGGQSYASNNSWFNTAIGAGSQDGVFCSVIGTTGSGPALFQANAVLGTAANGTSGQIVAFNNVTIPGSYTTNPTNVVAESVVPSPASACVTNQPVASAALVNPGSTSGTPTPGSAVYLIVGGTLLSGAAASVNVTVGAGGTITAVGSMVNPGNYAVPPPSPAALIYSSGTGAGVVGATVNLTMVPAATLNLNIGFSMVRPTVRGSYATLPPTPLCISPACTVAHGGGLTFAHTNNTGGAFMYGTDDTVAWQSAITQANTQFLAGTKTCVYAPPGGYMVQAPMPTFTSPGCIYGESETQTWLIATPQLNGDLLSWSNAWADGFGLYGFGDGGIEGSARNQVPGPYLANMSLMADRTGGTAQNAVVLYDRNHFVHFTNLYIQGFNGYAIAVGIMKNTTAAYLQESRIDWVRAQFNGNATHPTMLFDSQSAVVAPNNPVGATGELRMTHIDIYASYGDGVRFSATSGGGAGTIFLDQFRVEAHEFDAIQGGDHFVIGTPDSVSRVSGLSCLMCHLVNPYFGHSGLRMDANSLVNSPFSINFWGVTFVGATNDGQAMLVNYGRTSMIWLNGLSTVGPAVTLGPNAGADIQFTGTSGTEGSAVNFYTQLGAGRMARYPMVYGIPGSSANFFDLNYPDASAIHGGALGNGSVNLQIARVMASQTASGTQSAVVGGQNNTASATTAATLGGNGNTASGIGAITVGGSLHIASGQDCAVLAGASNSCTGPNSIVVGGQSGTDRGRWGNVVFPGVRLPGVVTSQRTDTTVQCTVTTANPTTPCTLTADAQLPGAANCINPPDRSAFFIEIALMAIDATAPTTNFYSAIWNAAHTLTRGTGASTTKVDNTQPVLPAGVAPDSNKSVGTPGSAVMAADLTNGCLALVYLPPVGNTHQIDATAHVKTVEVQ